MAKLTFEEELAWITRVDRYQEIRRAEFRHDKGSRKCAGPIVCGECGGKSLSIGKPCDLCGKYITAKNHKRIPCGNELSETIIGLPFDGKRYVLKCVRCGLKIPIIRPGPLTEEDLKVYGI